MATLFSNWHFVRVLRAGIAAWSFYEFSQVRDWMFLVLGGIFAVQAVFDVGCCGATGCATPRQKTVASSTEDVVYEEVK